MLSIKYFYRSGGRAVYRRGFCGRSLVGIVGTNPDEGMDVCLL